MNILNEMTGAEILDIVGYTEDNTPAWESIKYSPSLNISEDIFNEIKAYPKKVEIIVENSFFKSLKHFSEKNKSSVAERVKFALVLISRKKVLDPRFSQANNSPYRVHATQKTGEDMICIDVSNRKYVLRFPMFEKNSDKVHVMDIVTHSVRGY